MMPLSFDIGIAERFLKYHLFSLNRKGHGIHSPFVFKLVTEVLRNKTDPTIVLKLRALRKTMRRDKRRISVTDYGCRGTESGQTDTTVASVAKRSPVTEKYGILLMKLAAEFGKPYIIELGTSLGLSAMYMAHANRNTGVRTIEGCPETARIAREYISNSGLINIEVFDGEFAETMPFIFNENEAPGLIFIDGDHRKDKLLENFSYLVRKAGENTVIVIDDINYSKEMNEAWNELKSGDGISVTIDIFRMGLVFFRSGMSRFDYVVGY